MKKDDKASISLIKILGISLILIFMTSIGVMASNASLTSVKIILSNDYEMTVLTSKTTVGEILEENHIVLLEDETVTPDKQEELPDNKTIKIVKKTEDEQEIAEAEAVVTTEEILATYDTIVEKIVTEQVEIPFETITKEATGEGTKQNQVIQKGQNGLKEVKYKVKYQSVLKWNFEGGNNELLPDMKMDTLIYSKDETIILDTKYYKEYLSTNYDKKTLISANMYQMLAYLNNINVTNSLRGILLYPLPFDLDPINESYNAKVVSNNDGVQDAKIQFITIDLSKNWKEISYDLLSIVDVELAEKKKKELS